jgi:magnesium transporter
MDAKVEHFFQLDRELAEDLFLALSRDDQSELVANLPTHKRRSWLRILPLDEVADVIQRLDQDQRESCLDLLDPESKREVMGLLAYAEDDAGGLMTPHIVRLKPDMEVQLAIRYLRTYSAHHDETIYYCYVVESGGRLVGVVSLRELLLAAPLKKVSELMKTDLVTVREETDQEDLAKLFSQHGYSAIPVVDVQGGLKGVVTYDDAARALEQEATEDIQKIGGMEALDLPYWKTTLWEMLKKRGGWLAILFVGESFTASAMARYEDDIQRTVLLAMFIPLIISSGGNSGSQASTLIIRAMALGEVRLRNWSRVLWRELKAGIGLGLILGTLGFAKIVFWPNAETRYGEHFVLVGLTVALSLVGVVVWGALAGSMLPIVLKRLGLDPASASAPFVATLVDVTGIVIYFSVAGWLLSGTLM